MMDAAQMGEDYKGQETAHVEARQMERNEKALEARKTPYHVASNFAFRMHSSSENHDSGEGVGGGNGGQHSPVFEYRLSHLEGVGANGDSFHVDGQDQRHPLTNKYPWGIPPRGASACNNGKSASPVSELEIVGHPATHTADGAGDAEGERHHARGVHSSERYSPSERCAAGAALDLTAALDAALAAPRATGSPQSGHAPSEKPLSLAPLPHAGSAASVSVDFVEAEPPQVSSLRKSGENGAEPAPAEKPRNPSSLSSGSRSEKKSNNKAPSSTSSASSIDVSKQNFFFRQRNPDSSFGKRFPPVRERTSSFTASAPPSSAALWGELSVEQEGDATAHGEQRAKVGRQSTHPPQSGQQRPPFDLGEFLPRGSSADALQRPRGGRWKVGAVLGDGNAGRAGASPLPRAHTYSSGSPPTRANTYSAGSLAGAHSARRGFPGPMHAGTFPLRNANNPDDPRTGYIGEAPQPPAARGAGEADGSPQAALRRRADPNGAANPTANPEPPAAPPARASTLPDEELAGPGERAFGFMQSQRMEQYRLRRHQWDKERSSDGSGVVH